MSTVDKGNQLEDELYAFLCDQLAHGRLVYGVHSPNTCRILKKKSYYCRDREADVEFDIVVEITGEGRNSPHSYLIFECKNYRKSVPETVVTDFSHKLQRVFGHSAKGVLVFSSRLQRGAEKVAQSAGIGLAKFDAHGLEIKADRRSFGTFDSHAVEEQLFDLNKRTKPLKFSAFLDGMFIGSVNQLLQSVIPQSSILQIEGKTDTIGRVSFLSDHDIQTSARTLHIKTEYDGGPVDLSLVCSLLSLDLRFSGKTVLDISGEPILGSANFDNRTIEVNLHQNKYRERFTISHEIGHFFLEHGKYLRSESVVARDLFVENSCNDASEVNDYTRMEHQANKFASELLLPFSEFAEKAKEIRSSLGIQDRGHGFRECLIFCV